MNSFVIYFYPYTFYAGLALMVFCLYLLRRAGHGWLHVVVFTLFWLYGMLILSQALFPIPVVEMDAASARREIGEVFGRINWSPFQYVYHALGRAIFKEILLNFLITVPAGLVLPYLFKLRERGILITLAACGLGIELMQLALSVLVKLSYRVVDISDVILNSAGFLMGYVLFLLFSYLFRRFKPGTRA
jgi:glycopeptide antibiotics resistance protein